MQYFPPALENLVEQFAKLPGVGVKSAQRLAFYVLSMPDDEANAFAQAVISAKTTIHCCPVCQNLTEGEGPCAICRSPKRDPGVVCVVAMYEKPQILPLPDMYGKNLTFKTGGVDGCDCEETLKLIAEGKINTEPLITHTYPLSRIEEAYELFENKRNGVIKVAVEC